MQEFYTVAINELILTTIAGIVAVSIVGFIFIPHWTAVLFVSPLITTLYIDLLGKSSPAEWRFSDLIFVQFLIPNCLFVLFQVRCNSLVSVSMLSLMFAL
jgi:hypothetical protein